MPTPTPTPTPPTLEPFASTVTPNLMAGGPYDTVLTQIMEYLASLKSYLDTQFTTLEGDVTELGTELNDLSGTVGAWDKSEHDNVSMAEFCGNLVGDIGITLPIRISAAGNSVVTDVVPLLGISSDGGYKSYQGLSALIGNLMLAAPNGDHTQLFGYLGDNTADLTIASTTVRSSAALTYAAESGGTAGNVYGVPVDLASDGTVTLAVGGSVTIHQNETLFVCSSEYEGFTAGTIAEYNGSSSVELSDSAGQNIAAELVAVYVPTGGTAEVPVGTLSVQGEYGQVFKKTEGGTEPVDLVSFSDNQITDMMNPSSSAFGLGISAGIPVIDAVEVHEGESTHIQPIFVRAEDEPLTSQDLAHAQKAALGSTLTNNYIVILEP